MRSTQLSGNICHFYLFQILATNLRRNVLQLEGRINNQILGMKGFKERVNQILFVNLPTKHDSRRI